MRSKRKNQPNPEPIIVHPSQFREVVQRLTGAPPVISSSSSSSSTSTPAQEKAPLTPKTPAFNLHEERQSSKKMKLTVDTITNPYRQFNRGFLVSPVSHFDPFWTHVSPHTTPKEHQWPSEDEVEKAIAEKGFYIFPSPRSSTDPPPKLLDLFPLHPTNSTNHQN